MPTVIVGSARDVVEQCGVPRFLFTDFPLGNPCGRPWDAPMQRAIVEQALALFTQATAPCTTVSSPFRAADDAWRQRYLQVREEDLPRLRAAGDARRATRARLRREGRAAADQDP